MHRVIAVTPGTMNFSEVFKQSNQLCKVSPDGKYLVGYHQYHSSKVLTDVHVYNNIFPYCSIQYVQYTVQK